MSLYRSLIKENQMSDNFHTRDGKAIDWQELGLSLLAGAGDNYRESLLDIEADHLQKTAVSAGDGHPYGRRILYSNDNLEIMLASWRPHADCAPHNHGLSTGIVMILEGEFEETSYEVNKDGLCAIDYARLKRGEVCTVKQNEIHAMKSLRESGMTLHIYKPQIVSMEVYDVQKSEVFTVAATAGAWLPVDSKQITRKDKFAQLPIRCNLILYTTKYRLGGEKFKRAAERRAQDSTSELTVLRAIESKADFVEAVREVERKGHLIEEFNFFGHSGVYGIMFGTTKWPEQFSPYEWKNLRIPFAVDAHANFHACRTAIWFAPFFANQFRVKAYGHKLYTTISAAPETFKWEGFAKNPGKDIYIISCRGKKSHGISGSMIKYLGAESAISMTCFNAADLSIDRSYDSVAELYQDTFDDINVRSDEMQWLDENMAISKEKFVLDIGCGNGALLRRCAGRIGKGFGVDSSKGMIDVAKANSTQFANLEFVKIDGPTLPFPDNYFDEIVLMLSFRYLDWDPIVEEMLRVVKPGGHINVLDMVTAPVRITELPKLVHSKIKHYIGLKKNPQYRKALSKMVSNKAWGTMVRHNPIRSQHEFKWFLESRFRGAKTSLINVGWSSRILAFRSLPISDQAPIKLSYP
jgi:ubiquinone/menaquinone biosynthesis C-methylase UbiE/predicted metal-dependent enzyme (double-stranded beta helix superfamily)